MSRMLVVPPGVVGHVREGLLGVLAPVCRSLAQAQATPTTGRLCGWQREPLARLDRVGALLDIVGHSSATRPGRVMVDVVEHGWALLEALDCEARVLGRLTDEAIVYQPAGPGRLRLTGKLRVLRGFAATVEERILAGGATRVDARGRARLDPCVGDVELVERALLDLAPGMELGSRHDPGREPSSGSRRRDDFAACCLHWAR